MMKQEKGSGALSLPAALLLILAALLLAVDAGKAPVQSPHVHSGLAASAAEAALLSREAAIPAG